MVDQERQKWEREYNPHPAQPNKIPKQLFQKLDAIIYDNGYLCYHDFEGCNFVLNLIVNELHKYKIQGEC